MSSFFNTFSSFAAIRHGLARRVSHAAMVAVLVVIYALPAKAQDIHFSQIDVNPVLFNPAYAGFFEGKARFGLTYRNQWASVSKPYQTFAASAEASITRNRYLRNGFNAALLAYRDQAGTLGYGTTGANLVLSYYQSPTGSTDNYLSISAEAGYAQAGFNAGAVDFFDNTETLNKTSCSYFTIGAGAAWFYQPSEDLSLRVALSARNLNRPNLSYMGLDSNRLAIKWNLYSRAEWRLKSDFSVLPIAAFQYQRNNYELYYGADVKWYVIETDRQLVALGGGLMFRNADAFIVDVQLEYNAFLLALSYDANISKLVAASRSIGALELGLVYRIIPIKKQLSSMPCPIM